VANVESYYQDQQLPQPVIPSLPPAYLLKGQTALVTGANSGIGRAIALALGRAGADVVVNYVAAPEDATRVVDEIRQGGRRAMAVQADVSNEAEVETMFDRVVEELGTVDILVNNAGLQKDAPFHEMTTAHWDSVMNVNLRGAFLCSRAAVREFRRRGVRPDVSVAAGKIVFISSVHEVIPWAGHVNYAASKGGYAAQEKLGAGGRGAAHPGQQHCPRSYSHTDQYRGVANVGSLHCAYEAHPLQADRRSRGDRPGSGLAGVRLHRLHRWLDDLCRRGNDAVSWFRMRRIDARQMQSISKGGSGYSAVRFALASRPMLWTDRVGHEIRSRVDPLSGDFESQ
jgi:NADP-dependent 3-hydroxy acid dehydrogenase YdfG